MPRDNSSHDSLVLPKNSVPHAKQNKKKLGIKSQENKLMKIMRLVIKYDLKEKQENNERLDYISIIQ